MMKKIVNNFGSFLFFATLLVYCQGCTPEKKMQRIIKKHPELVKTDTLTVVDTVSVTTNRVHTDTITTLEHFLSDTIVIQKENLTVRTFVHKDSVFIEGECDTIRVETIREIAIPVERIEVKEVQSKWVWPLVFICVFLAFILIYSRKK